MAESDDIQAILSTKLTARQCQILYWVCNDLKYQEISPKMNLSVSAIQAEMTKIYEVFDLDHLDRNKRRAKLYQTICPIFLRKVKEPGACPDELVDVPSTPDPKVYALVVRDAQEQNIPHGRASETAPRGDIFDPRPRGLPTSHSRDRLAYLGLGILATLLTLAIAFIAFLISGGGSDFIAHLQKTPTPIVIEHRQTEVGSSSTAVPQPASTALPPSPLVQTVVEAAPGAVQTATSTSGFLDVSGKVPSDLPGMNLTLGSTVYSVVAPDTKPRDVYAVPLEAGRDLVLDVSVNGCVWLDLYNPGSTSIGITGPSNTFNKNACNTRWEAVFTPAVSGTYYLAVREQGSSTPYDLHISQR